MAIQAQSDLFSKQLLQTNTGRKKRKGRDFVDAGFVPFAMYLQIRSRGWMKSGGRNRREYI